ncbi:MAG: 6-bladed beta-propeller, partial [Solirubrobacterales bacterium]
GNSATGTNNFAGAVRRQAGDLTVTNSTFTGNQATDAPAISSSDSITLKSVTLSANSGPYDIDAGFNLSIGNSIINETGEACRAPLPPSTYKVNLGGNVIADTTLSDCDPFVGTGGGPGSKVAASAIQLGPLASNGGPTQTMALGLTSVAASSAGVNLLGSNPKDQRGRTRPGVNQSSGAYQLTEPANSAIPQISGDAVAGETLTSSTGTWSVSPPVTSYGYQWQRCEVSNSPTYVNGWGGAGSGNGQFNTPEWVAVDPSGNVFVADRGNDRIQKFDASGNYLGKWGSAGNGPGQFQNIGGVAVGAGGEVYVTDTGDDRVQKFTNSGIFLTQWGSQGSTNGKFNSPGPLATDSSGNVYVTDYNNARVQKFTANGGYLTQWGSSGSGPGQFTSPGGIAVDPSGNVYVVDIYSHRVEKFTGTGTFLTQWGSNGSGDGQFTSPTGIAVASSGTVYVADRNTSRIQAFSPTGTYLIKWRTAGSGPGQIDDPGGLAFGTGGDLYEADVYNARIQQFETLSCAAISGATASTYPQTRSDMGKTIRVEVTADNDVPPVEEALSFPTTPVLAIPENSSSPTISGSPAVGGTLTASAGTWSAYPEATLTYQWQRCEQDGTGCTEIAGATNPTYTPIGSDAGKKLRVAEKGTNVVGNTTANSAQVGPVTGPPVNVEPPTVTGDLVLGSTLTANPGTWSGYPTPTLSFQWQRCDAGGSNCSDIAGATGQTYVLIADDEGKEIRIVVTAVNSIDSVRTDSAPTGEVAPVPPTPTGKPKLRIEIEGPKRIRAGRPFRIGIEVTNRAGGNAGAQRAAGTANPTTAKSVRTCVGLPRGVMLVASKGQTRIEGRSICWTRRSLAAGKSFSHGFRGKTVRGMSRPATFQVTVSATNSSGATSTTRATDRIEVSPAERPEPKPPTG